MNRKELKANTITIAARYDLLSPDGWHSAASLALRPARKAAEYGLVWSVLFAELTHSITQAIHCGQAVEAASYHHDLGFVTRLTVERLSDGQVWLRRRTYTLDGTALDCGARFRPDEPTTRTYEIMYQFSVRELAASLKPWPVSAVKLR